jgi:hypothetical protein
MSARIESWDVNDAEPQVQIKGSLGQVVVG